MTTDEEFDQSIACEPTPVPTTWMVRYSGRTHPGAGTLSTLEADPGASFTFRWYSGGCEWEANLISESEVLVIDAIDLWVNLGLDPTLLSSVSCFEHSGRLAVAW